MRTLGLSDAAVQEAADVIRGGGVLVYPTETAYALGADTFRVDAIRRVFSIKGREEQKPMGLIAGSAEQVERICMVSAQERGLFQFWPGPLSVVLSIRTDIEPDILAALHAASGGRATISIRVSGHDWARALALAINHPILATSANRSGMGECFDPACVSKQFTESPQPDMLIDGGTLPAGSMSTVIAVTDETVHILRRGAVDSATIVQAGFSVEDINTNTHA